VFHGPNADEEEIRKTAECAIELGVIGKHTHVCTYAVSTHACGTTCTHALTLLAGSIRVSAESQIVRVGILEGHENVFSIKVSIFRLIFTRPESHDL